MRSRSRWMRAAALVAVMGAGTLGIAACAGPSASRPPSAEKAHRPVDTGLQTCAGCHAQVTPQVAAQWRDGRHGMSLVQCVVCHGSTGADFKARPGTAACSGCHPVQVASASQGCFGCHSAHALHVQGAASPHGIAGTGGAR